jgi:glycosyltransferase involved in cell wall biosynthesis
MFGLGLIRFVPAALRPPIIRAVDLTRQAVTGWQLRRETVRPPRHFPPDSPVILIGLFASPTGLGQGARLMLADLRRHGRGVTAVDATRALRLPGGALPEGVLPHSALATLPPGPVVVHLNPPLYGYMYLLMPKSLRLASRMIAYWAWELDQVPEHWLVDAGITDEIWAPSDFVAEALRRRLGPAARQPVRVVPHPVEAIPFGPRRTPADIAAARARHGLPAATFIAGTSFAMSSNFARKNPLAAIAAFQAAFPPGGREARLILRCNDRDIWPPGHAALEKAAAADPRILIFDGAARRIPIGDLYLVLDVYLSLHRSEGYGLNLAEAASLGTPVLATGWGLAADIAARPEVTEVAWRLVPVEDPQRVYTDAGARWAEPDIADAAAKLRSLASG